MRMSGTKRFFGLLGWFLLCMAIMAVGGAVGYLRLNPHIDDWFQSLNKPAWVPPPELFFFIWVALFMLMSVAVWIVWMQHEEPMAKLGVKFFMTQLVLILVWVAVFFGVKNPGAGAIEVVVLWLSIFATLCLFWQRSRMAGLLMFPQLAWFTFVAYLNVVIWQLNA